MFEIKILIKLVKITKICKFFFTQNEYTLINNNVSCFVIIQNPYS